MKRLLSVTLLVVLTALQSFAAAGKKQVTLRITEASTFVFDETKVYLDLGASQFVNAEDAQKVFDTTSSAPLIYSFSSDMVSCYSNSYGSLVPATVIPVGIKVSGNGTYVISGSLIDNFDAASIIRLEDRALGVFYDLRQSNYPLTINQPTQLDGRFFLHISAPPVISTIPAGCSNNDGIISVSPDFSVHWSSADIYDNNFNLVASYPNVTTSFSSAGLAFGNYNVVFTLSGYTAVKPTLLNGKSVAVQVAASTTHTSVGQTLQFFATATNATNYLWDMGEGSQISGVVNPTFFYTQAGVFDASIRCSNVFGCSSVATISIIVDEATSVASIMQESISVTAQNKTLRVMFNKPVESSYNLQLFNSVGQQLVSNTLTSGENSFDLTNLPSGIYIARIANEQGSFSQKIVLQ